MGKICLTCSYPNSNCNACPLTYNYWTSLPQGFVISSSGTSSPCVTEGRIREIIKKELEKSNSKIPIKNNNISGIVGTIKIEADVESFKKAAECIGSDTKTKGLTFSQAFEIIRNDPTKGMRLPFWSSEVVIKVQNPDVNSKMTHPYLYVESRKGKVPWRETFPELFSCDWEIVDTTIKIDFLYNNDTGSYTVSGHKGPVSSNSAIHNSDFPNTTYTSQ